jgi:hypothetical protein
VKSGAYDYSIPAESFYFPLGQLLRTGAKTPSPPSTSTGRRISYPTGTANTQAGPAATILSTSFGSSSGSSYRASPDSPRGSLDDEEDSNETITNTMIQQFAHALCKLLYSANLQLRPEVSLAPDSLLLMLGGTGFRSINDGSIWKTRFSKSQRQWVKVGGAPILTLEVLAISD